ncbi:Methyltransferase domain-containing protein [Geobacter sp. DSM 9736]|nr:Methyltransferase domain-containing protein [Geobacter sp. DSM 9736]
MISAPMEEDRIKWNRRYTEEEWYLGQKPSRYLVEHMDFIMEFCPGRKALDIACGEGRNSVFLARNGFSVTGVDISETGLAKARQWARLEELSIDFVHADLASYPLEGTYDLIINFNFLLRELIPSMVAALSAGGLLVFDTILDTPALPGVHKKEYLLQPGELHELFAAYAGTVHFPEERPEEVSPTAKLIFRKY